ncbi:GNAT family N-acetyltransferase [Desulfovibrio inopinatus]|uniref:GNAT family N-acetyltransferase n=1 Tax=Desulfovibrio inopinatus TaxID=102109 RepID=UPI00040FF074|nr:GNAT family N-acetyltransferase [Desulfovibrio inopinatus]
MKVTAPLSPIKKLCKTHDTGPFDCGYEEFNRYLKRYALASQQAHSAQTYVATRGDLVVGYYSLAVGGVEHRTVPERVAKGLARHLVPVMVLARLAVDVREQRHGLGKGLLKDALLRTIQAADIAGIRALFVVAKDDAAKAFYEHFNFDPSPTDPYRLFLVMKDLKTYLRRE